MNHETIKEELKGLTDGQLEKVLGIAVLMGLAGDRAEVVERLRLILQEVKDRKLKIGKNNPKGF